MSDSASAAILLNAIWMEIFSKQTLKTATIARMQDDIRFQSPMDLFIKAKSVRDAKKATDRSQLQEVENQQKTPLTRRPVAVILRLLGPQRSKVKTGRQCPTMGLQPLQWYQEARLKRRAPTTEKEVPTKFVINPNPS
jgi:hypothetical protein